LVQSYGSAVIRAHGEPQRLGAVSARILFGFREYGASGVPATGAWIDSQGVEPGYGGVPAEKDRRISYGPPIIEGDDAFCSGAGQQMPEAARTHPVGLKGPFFNCEQCRDIAYFGGPEFHFVH